jgi:hypothetical protein
LLLLLLKFIKCHLSVVLGESRYNKSVFGIIYLIGSPDKFLWKWKISFTKLSMEIKNFLLNCPCCARQVLYHLSRSTSPQNSIFNWVPCHLWWLILIVNMIGLRYTILVTSAYEEVEEVLNLFIQYIFLDQFLLHVKHQGCINSEVKQQDCLWEEPNVDTFWCHR